MHLLFRSLNGTRTALSHKWERLRPAGAFTLIELLVVISIIALLASLLLPAIGTGQEQGRITFCSNTLSHLGKSLFTYANDNKDYLPAAAWANVTWDTQLLPYIEEATNLFRCPSDRLHPSIATNAIRTYSVNGNSTDSEERYPFGVVNRTRPFRMSDLDSHMGDIILISERPGTTAANRGVVGMTACCTLDEIAATIHRSGKGGNYLMGSMSVRYMRPAETKPIEPTNYWTFTLPQ